MAAGMRTVKRSRSSVASLRSRAPRRATEHELEARAEGVLERVMALPLEYREAIYLHYYEGYSIKQIAAIVHASESAVATRLSRGRSKLRPALEGVRHELDF